MQTVQQEFDPVQHGLTRNGHPVLRQMLADPAVAYAEEVRTLRQRVVLLEAELAAFRASAGGAGPMRPAAPLASTDSSPDRRPERSASEFTEALTPAVMAVAPATQHAPITAETAKCQTATSTLATAVSTESAVSAGPAEAVPNRGFAQAWTAQDTGVSFEERVAEKAFFQASTIDDESRSWLLEL